MKRSTIIILVVIGVILLWGIVTRNNMASAVVDINGKWGQVQAEYNRKAKLYTNVVATIKGAAHNEDTTLIKIVQMRSRVPNITPASTPQEVTAADNQLNSIGHAALNVNIEAYPTLQATGLYRDLQAQIEGTENRVTIALGDWNDAITAYNNHLVRFPGNIIAGLFGYQPKQNYVAPEGSENTTTNFDQK